MSKQNDDEQFEDWANIVKASRAFRDTAHHYTESSPRCVSIIKQTH